MADVSSSLKNWSTTASSNSPAGSTSIGGGLDDNLREIQAVVRQLASSDTIASATTTDLGSKNAALLDVTGTTTITSFGTVSTGIWKILTFAGALTLTHNATSLILPGGSNITTAAGDSCMAESLGSGNWKIHAYQKASGNPVATQATVPTGTVFPYAGSSAPTGYLICDGAAVSRTTYATLFALIGTTYGVGDGSSTFNVPDIGGRVVAGKESSATRLTSGVSGVDGATLGATGGNQNMHQHTHAVTDPGHTHTHFTLLNAIGGGAGGWTIQASGGTTATSSNTTGITNANTGSGSSQNVQPTIVLNYIIKT